MDSLKKAAAILCSAAALVVFGAAAFPANAFETVDLNDRSSELKADTVNIVADQVYAEPGETVDYRVLLSGNTGYANSGIALVYDPALEVKREGQYEPVMTVGMAANGLMTENSLNLKDHIVAFSSTGTTDCKNSGTLYTVHFTVPADAADGDTYPLSIEIRHFHDKMQVEVSHAIVNGWIKIRKPVTTTVTTVTTPVTTTQPTTTIVTTTTTVPTTTTSTVTTTSTTPAPVTTPEPVTTTEPPVTTVAPPDTEPPVVTTTTTTEPVTEPVTQKTTRALTPTNGATTAKGGTKPAVPGVKTGDVNTGAAAGLMLAVSTAAALKLRKKED